MRTSWLIPTTHKEMAKIGGSSRFGLDGHFRAVTGVPKIERKGDCFVLVAPLFPEGVSEKTTWEEAAKDFADLLIELDGEASGELHDHCFYNDCFVASGECKDAGYDMPGCNVTVGNVAERLLNNTFGHKHVWLPDEMARTDFCRECGITLYEYDRGMHLHRWDMQTKQCKQCGATAEQADRQETYETQEAAT